MMSEIKNDNDSEFSPAGLEKVRDTVADAMHVTARTIADRPPSADDNPTLVDWKMQASQWLDHWSDELRELDVRKGDARLRASIAGHPGRMLLVAGAVGVLLSHALRRR